MSFAEIMILRDNIEQLINDQTISQGFSRASVAMVFRSAETLGSSPYMETPDEDTNGNI